MSPLVSPSYHTNKNPEKTDGPSTRESNDRLRSVLHCVSKKLGTFS